jgi:hypothetical protein
MKTIYLGITGDIGPEEMAEFVRVLEKHMGIVL